MHTVSTRAEPTPAPSAAPECTPHALRGRVVVRGGFYSRGMAAGPQTPAAQPTARRGSGHSSYRPLLTC
eukprot:7135779-Pyramimonas_sp.AAC.1